MFSSRVLAIVTITATLVLAGPAPAALAKTVGLILPKDCAFSQDTKEKFSAVLREQGFSNKDLEVFLQRPGADKVSRLNSMRKFLAFGVDVIVVWGGTSIIEVAREAGKTPIVFVGVWDPVGSAIVKGLKQPGGNVTGIMGKTSTGYLLDNVIETSGVKTLGVIYHSGLVDSLAQYISVRKAAPGKGLELIDVDFQKTPPEKIPGILEPASFLYMAQGCDVQGGVYEALANIKKPAGTQNPGVTGGGVVFTLAPDIDETIKVAAEMTARILKGEKPGEIPVARIKKVGFTINIGEARNLGLKVPFPVLNRGTKIIR